MKLKTHKVRILRNSLGVFIERRTSFRPRIYRKNSENLSLKQTVRRRGFPVRPENRYTSSLFKRLRTSVCKKLMAVECSPSLARAQEARQAPLKFRARKSVNIYLERREALRGLDFKSFAIASSHFRRFSSFTKSLVHLYTFSFSRYPSRYHRPCVLRVSLRIARRARTNDAPYMLRNARDRLLGNKVSLRSRHLPRTRCNQSQ